MSDDDDTGARDTTPEEETMIGEIIRLRALLAKRDDVTALAVLAMRERAAEICFVPEQAHIAWDMKNGNFPKRSARHEYIAAEIRALPTTFTDAELLAAAMQLPEVR